MSSEISFSEYRVFLISVVDNCSIVLVYFWMPQAESMIEKMNMFANEFLVILQVFKCVANFGGGRYNLKSD